MNRIIIALAMTVLVPSCAPAITNAELDRLIPALIQIESGGNDSAVGDSCKAVGCLQIWPVMVKDVNRITASKYTLADRYNRQKSIAICRAYMNHYGKRWTIEQAARHWNSGPSTTKGTDKYWNKVRKELAK